MPLPLCVGNAVQLVVSCRWRLFVGNVGHIFTFLTDSLLIAMYLTYAGIYLFRCVVVIRWSVFVCRDEVLFCYCKTQS